MQEERPDAGFTLLDTMMSMTVMTIVMAVFTTSVLSMHRASNNVEARSAAQTQINIAVQRLDHEIRYATGISAPYSYNGSQSVDFLTVDDGVRQCVQLRVAGGNLFRRSWTYRSAPMDLTGWSQLATGLTSPTVFAYAGPTTAIGHQQLVVTLVAGAATGPVIGRDANTVTFTALNSDRTSANDYCNAARSIP